MINVLRNSNKKELIQLSLLCLFAATIPLPVKFNNAILVSIGAYWLINGEFKFFVQNFRPVLVKLFVGLFLIITISAIISETEMSGFTDIEKYSGLLIAVIICGFKVSPDWRKLILLSFVASCVLCSIFSIVTTFHIYELTLAQVVSDTEIFSYYSWVLPNSINLPSNYYSLFIAFALVIIIQEISAIGILRYKALFLISGVILLVFMALLSSRTSFFALIIVVLIYFLRKVFFLPKKRLKYLTISTLFLATVIVLFFQTPYLKSRTLSLANGFNADPRYEIFQCGVEIFSKHPAFGAGILDAEAEALNCYREKNLKEALSEKYNLHNTYLQFAASTGAIGLLIFLALLTIIFRKAVQKQEIVHLGFIILFSIGSLTESLLSRNKGIIYFTFFSTLLFIMKSNEENTSR